jgi:hypothetical protein
MQFGFLASSTAGNVNRAHIGSPNILNAALHKVILVYIGYDDYDYDDDNYVVVS